MPTAFISYKRGDCDPVVGMLHDRLNAALGADNVFLDVVQIGAGEDFAVAIDRAITASDVLVILVTKSWTEPSSQPSGSGDDRDWIAIEIEAAARNHVFLLPVLVDNTPVEAIDLRLGKNTRLARCNAISLKSETASRDSERIGSEILRLSARDNWRVRERARWLSIRIAATDDEILVSGSTSAGRFEYSRNSLASRLLWSTFRNSVGRTPFDWPMLSALKNVLFAELLNSEVARLGRVTFDSDSESAVWPIELLVQAPPGDRERREAASVPVIRNPDIRPFYRLEHVSPSDTALVILAPSREALLTEDSELTARRYTASLRTEQATGRRLVVCSTVDADLQSAVNALVERAYRIVVLVAQGRLVTQISRGDRQCGTCGHLIRGPVQHESRAGLIFTRNHAPTEPMLTPLAFSALRYLPDLVCVELSEVEWTEQDGVVAANAHVALSKFADTYARELLQIGVAFVVVYLAPDRDALAQVFAHNLLNKMLKGQSFGVAVQSALTAFFRGQAGEQPLYPPLCFGDPTRLLAAPAASVKHL